MAAQAAPAARGSCDRYDPGYKQYKQNHLEEVKVETKTMEETQEKLDALKEKMAISNTGNSKSKNKIGSKNKRSKKKKGKDLTNEEQKEMGKLQSLVDSYKDKPHSKLLKPKAWCCRSDGPLAHRVLLSKAQDWTHHSDQMHHEEDGSESKTSGWQKWIFVFTYRQKQYRAEAHIHFAFANKNVQNSHYAQKAFDKVEIFAQDVIFCKKRDFGHRLHQIIPWRQVKRRNIQGAHAEPQYQDIYRGNIVGYDADFYSHSGIDGIGYNDVLDDGYMNNYQYGHGGSSMMVMLAALIIIACLVCCNCFICGAMMEWMRAKCAKSQHHNKRRMSMDAEFSEV